MFLVHFGIVQIGPMYHSLDKRIWSTFIFLPLKESLSLSVPDMDFFSIPLVTFSDLELSTIVLELSRIVLPKLTPSILMKIVQRIDFLKSLFLS